MLIRPAQASDQDALWSILEPVIRAGETYALPRDWTRGQALDYWLAAPHRVFVAEAEGRVLGTYYLQPNQLGGGAHVANCGFMTHSDAVGRGVARAMCSHALETAGAQGFRAMQFNFVVAVNHRAVALWRHFGFRVLATLPAAFEHPTQGYVDALVMFREIG